jgi:MFS family permease
MREIPREAESTAMGFFQAVYAIGMTAFPMLTGAVAGSLGNISAYGVLAALAAAAGIAAWLYFTRQKRI